MIAELEIEALKDEVETYKAKTELLEVRLQEMANEIETLRAARGRTDEADPNTRSSRRRRRR